jgi:hypothetical protein
MADGTLRAELDFEPRFAADAFRLLGQPGQPVAVAALKTAAQHKPASDKPKGGPLSQWLAMRCDEAEFRLWLATAYREDCMAVALDMPDKGPGWQAAEVVRRVCEVESRADIDNHAAAAQRFQERIRGPWKLHNERSN